MGIDEAFRIAGCVFTIAILMAVIAAFFAGGYIL